MDEAGAKTDQVKTVTDNLTGDVTTYSYVDGNALKASPLTTGKTAQLVAAGAGIGAVAGGLAGKGGTGPPNFG